MALTIDRHQLEFQIVDMRSYQIHDWRPEKIMWEAHLRTDMPNPVGAHNQ